MTEMLHRVEVEGSQGSEKGSSRPSLQRAQETQVHAARHSSLRDKAGDQPKHMGPGGWEGTGRAEPPQRGGRQGAMDSDCVAGITPQHMVGTSRGSCCAHSRQEEDGA